MYFVQEKESHVFDFMAFILTSTVYNIVVGQRAQIKVISQSKNVKSVLTFLKVVMFGINALGAQ